ncbi:hypothetical protein LZ554_009551 [Drepanopeziza brunnea f. sp. 'monogermtubi']|nr:hypothetical protein LZ554_009551 [Drepanopeziza brunnea f. sp. 'monogermtubi']
MLPFRLYIFLLFCSISLFTQSASSKQAALHQPTTSLPLVFLHTSALAFENLVTTYLDTFRITQQHCRAAPYIQHERAYIYAHLIPFYTTIPPTSLELLRSAFRSINSNISAIAHSARPIHIAHLDALAALVDMLTEARDSFSLLFDAESRPGTGTSTTATASTTAGYTNCYLLRPRDASPG